MVLRTVFIFVFFEADRVLLAEGTVLKVWAVVSNDLLNAQVLADRKASSIGIEIKNRFLASVQIDL